MTSERLLTTQEAAEYLVVTAKTITKYIRDERLTATKIGKQWRIKLSDLEAFKSGKEAEPVPLNGNGAGKMAKETELIRAQIALEEVKGLRDKPSTLDAKEFAQNNRDIQQDERTAAQDARDDISTKREEAAKEAESLIKQSETAESHANSIVNGAEEKAIEIIDVANKKAQDIETRSLSNLGSMAQNIIKIAKIIHGSGVFIREDGTEDHIIHPTQKGSLLSEIRVILSTFGISLEYGWDEGKVDESKLLFKKDGKEIG